MDKKIDFYFDSIKAYRENYNKLQDKLKINEKELIIIEKKLTKQKKIQMIIILKLINQKKN